MLPAVKEPRTPFDPPHVVCQRSRMPYPGEPDGRLDKPFWQQTEPFAGFRDIEGDVNPRPLKHTEVRMLWDDTALYIGAHLDDDTIWATVDRRDEIIFVDNDFEVFLQPKDNTHLYYELEMNAMNTVWDLLMEKPQRDGVRRIYSWDIHGLRSAVHVEGRLNDPAADNRYWELELIIPWESLRDCKPGELEPVRIAPIPGEMWRLNFSRVEYRVHEEDGRYVKDTDPATGNPYPEYNWVWAPTGVIDIHMPEMWGYLLFADGECEFTAPADEQERWQLYRLYYRQRIWGAQHGAYTTRFDDLKGDDEWTIQPDIYVTPSLFEIVSGTLHIRQDGYMWRE